MVRKLKYHEQKLLKKLDFLASSNAENNLKEVKILRRYQIQKREDYTKYNKLSRHIRELARKIKDLDPKDPFRSDSTSQLIQKLYSIGLTKTRHNLEVCDNVSASSFCRRRLPVIMVNNNMTQSMKMAIQFIEQGHVRVGTEVVMDPAFLVTRNLEDFVTWVDASAIKKKIMEYNGMRDDFDAMN